MTYEKAIDELLYRTAKMIDESNVIMSRKERQNFLNNVLETFLDEIAKQYAQKIYKGEGL